MYNFRIIPRLEIKSGKVVKGMRMEGLKVMGDPTLLGKKYYNGLADELICEDIVATLYSRKFDKNLIKNLSKKIHIPIIAGGGVKSENDIFQLLKNGASKILINTEFYKNSQLLNKASKRFGKQCMVIQIQYQKINGSYYCFHTSGREKTKITVIDCIKKAINLGAGEIHLISIFNDGMENGMEFEFLKKVRSICSIPIVAGGGIGHIKHIDKLIDLNFDGVALGTILHKKKAEINEIKKSIKKKKMIRN